MSKLKSFISKRRGKEEKDVPTVFNALYQFNNENIINESKISDNPLNGCDISDTLYLEGEIKTSNYGFLLFGNHGCNVYSAVQKRVPDNIPATLIFAENKDFTNLDERIPFLELPSKELEESTFFQGTKWFENNKEMITSQIQRLMRNTSIVFIFCENDGFIFGIVSRVLEFLRDNNIQPILSLHLPIKGSNTIKEFSILAFIQYLMDKETTYNFPFILLDENVLVEAKPSVPLETIRQKLIHREVNIVLDFVFASLIPSEFYKVDFSNFLHVFQNARGPCKLLSFDIYDDKSELSHLFKNRKYAEGFTTKTSSTRGFLFIQPGLKGIVTSEYRIVREIYANQDVVFSILRKRSRGSLIRGIFTYNELPKTLLEKYQLFSDIIVELLDEQKNPVAVQDLSQLRDLWNHDFYKISIYSESQET